jgi:hypothetical protein
VNWQLPKSERDYLRELAKQQAAIAALPIMEQRKQMWYALNDAHPGARPPVVIETWTFDRDFMPSHIFRCQTQSGREIEAQLLRNIRNHELIDDDKVTPDTFDIGWFIEEDEFGVPTAHEVFPDAEGVEIGFRFKHPIRHLEKDFYRLQAGKWTVDREKTFAWQEFLNDLLGEYLPVEIRTGCHVTTMLTHRVVELMGMEAFFTAMYDQPEAVHALMTYLQDNALSRMHWLESEGLLRYNHRNQDSFGSSYNFTTRLPRPRVSQVEDEPSIPGTLNLEDDKPRLSDTWGCSNSQETVGISPRMFREFCFPYFRSVCEPMGLLYYGCCEPAHPFWNEISQLPHLKKVSISRWCDQRFMGEALRGTEIVFSRKPDPNYLSVAERLEEEAWAAHIRETLDATRKDVFVEFIIRDVYTLHGNLENARKAVEVARREIDKDY